MKPRAQAIHRKSGKKAALTSAPKPISASAPSLPATTPAPDKPKENVAYCPPPDELDHSVPNLKHLGGAKSDKWNLLLCNQVLNAAWYHRNNTEQEKADQHTAIFGFLAGVNPKDALEGMMAAQLFASHAAAMECYRRAMLPDQSAEGRQTNLAQAAKLTRANAAQIEALAKHRGKGQQKVIVEHVHVYQGGQAIVGNVTPGGSAKNLEVQPHAVNDTQSAPMRRENPEREALPVTGHAERTLQNARRPISRRS